MEKAGGLPPYVREIARSISKGGKDLSSAIAIAIGRIKVWASGKGVSGTTQAKATKALAAWEALKAKSGVESVAASALTVADIEFLEASAVSLPWSAGEDLLLRLSLAANNDEVALAASKSTRTDGKPSNDPASTKKFPSGDWQPAPAGMKCSRWQHGDNPPPAVSYRTVNGKKMGACASHKKEMSKSVSASAGSALDAICLAANGVKEGFTGKGPTQTKGSGDGSGKHDLIWFENRSTPKVVARGQKLGSYPDSYGKVTKRVAASADDEKKISGSGGWIRKDEHGNKPSDSGYKKTKVRPGLVS